MKGTGAGGGGEVTINSSLSQNFNSYSLNKVSHSVQTKQHFVYVAGVSTTFENFLGNEQTEPHISKTQFGSILLNCVISIAIVQNHYFLIDVDRYVRYTFSQQPLLYMVQANVLQQRHNI